MVESDKSFNLGKQVGLRWHKNKFIKRHMIRLLL